MGGRQPSARCRRIGRWRLTANGVARKWRRNDLKRLNPRPEMVWSWKPRTHKIWYTGAADRCRTIRRCHGGAPGEARKFSWLQALEKSRNGVGISAAEGLP